MPAALYEGRGSGKRPAALSCGGNTRELWVRVSATYCVSKTPFPRLRTLMTFHTNEATSRSFHLSHRSAQQSLHLWETPNLLPSSIGWQEARSFCTGHTLKWPWMVSPTFQAHRNSPTQNAPARTHSLPHGPAIYWTGPATGPLGDDETNRCLNGELDFINNRRRHCDNSSRVSSLEHAGIPSL